MADLERGPRSLGPPLNFAIYIYITNLPNVPLEDIGDLLPHIISPPPNIFSGSATDAVYQSAVFDTHFKPFVRFVVIIFGYQW